MPDKEPKYPIGMKKEYDSEHELSYGYFRCDICKRRWYPGLGAMQHTFKCVIPRFSGSVVWCYGPNGRFTKDWVSIQESNHE
jgi:hypothetical protein